MGREECIDGEFAVDGATPVMVRGGCCFPFVEDGVELSIAALRRGIGAGGCRCIAHGATPVIVTGGCVFAPGAPVDHGATPRPIVPDRARPEDGSRLVGGGIDCFENDGRHEPMPALREVSMGTNDSAWELLVASSEVD